MYLLCIAVFFFLSSSPCHRRSIWTKRCLSVAVSRIWFYFGCSILAVAASMMSMLETFIYAYSRDQETVLFNMNNINNINNNNNENSDSSSSSDKNEKRNKRSNERTPQYFYYRLDVILWVLQRLQSVSIQYSYTHGFTNCLSLIFLVANAIILWMLTFFIIKNLTANTMMIN